MSGSKTLTRIIQLNRRPGIPLSGAQVLPSENLDPGQTTCREDATKKFLLIFVAWIPAWVGMTDSFLLAEPLNMTISGKSAEKVPLETLVPSPDIPAANALSLSLDGGKSAASDELDALLISQAVLDLDITKMPMPSLSAIPDAPYIVQAVPIELEKQRDNKLKKRDPKIRFTNWEFLVVDELNNIVHQKTGDGFPPTPLTWDGMKEGAFVLRPNRTYFSTLKLMAHGEPDHTIVGESVRFMAFLRQDGNDTVIRMGENIYKKDEAQFSEESKIYLDDLSQRLSHNMTFYKEGAEFDWHVVVYEPASKEALGQARKNLWKSIMETMLGRKLDPRHFMVKNSESEDSSASLIFPQAKPPLTDLALRGEAKSNLKPIIENMNTVIKMTEDKKFIVVDLRHDRLFQPGSAYLKDSTLPYLTQAITQVQSLLGKEKKKLLLRSYTQKLPDEKEKDEDDPKLTATRSKVLFMLFARETLSPK